MEKTKENKKINKKKAAIMLAALLAGGGIGVGGAAAYFSATSATRENDVSIVAGKQGAGKDDTGTDGEKGVLRITEDNWHENDAQNSQPGNEITKDPVITSKAAYDGYIMVKVSVPTVQARLGDETTLTRHDMFDIVQDDASKAKWKLVDSDETAADHSDYYYAYQGTLQPDEATEDVFDSIREPQFTQVDAGGPTVKVKNGSIDVTAAIIQKTGNKQPTNASDNTTTKALKDALVKLTKENNKYTAVK